MKKPKLLLIFFLGILIGLCIKLFVIDIVRISGSSMEPTIHEGDTIFIWKLSYGLLIPFTPSSFVRWKEPKPGDIISYLHDNKIVIKRCLASEGDYLSFSSDSGYYMEIHRNKEPSVKVPLTEGQYQRLKMTGFVPKGFILAVGDNYTDSVDSRDYGFIVANEVTGRVICK